MVGLEISSVCAGDAFFTEPMTISLFSGGKVWRLTYLSTFHAAHCVPCYLVNFHLVAMVLPILQMERWSLKYALEN